MKISKLFHWLYTSLMFLPLLVAPLFAIYSHRHDINDYSIQVQETKAVDFNQLYDYTLMSDDTINGVTFDNLDNGYLHVFGTAIDYADYVYPVVFQPYDNPYLLGAYSVGGVSPKFSSLNGNVVDGFLEVQVTIVSQFYLRVEPNTSVDIIFSPQIFNLTQMFGSGNEPSVSQFRTWYSNSYYPYTLSHRELLKTGNYITYDDTDIGSQFLYDLYKTTDEYLNFDSVFNLYQVNDWINLNVFNGSVPLVWYIIWHYLDYWLLLSIFWLCFDVLIYVPQLAHRWLDKASLE